MHRFIILSLLVALTLMVGSIVQAADMVTFEPARAPSKGPDNAAVTVIEIADFM